MIIYSNPDTKSTPSIHFPPLGHPMAYMTENINLQRALLSRIREFGNGVVDVREGRKVESMSLGEGGRWVGLNLGDETWVRGSVVVSCFSSP
jgi:ubiquinone biosynthesis monooxygenase Coq6